MDDFLEQAVDVERLQLALAGLAPQYRAALTLRYLDDLAVAAVSEHLGRGIHATEALLQRAKRALRRAYEAGGSDE